MHNKFIDIFIKLISFIYINNKSYVDYKMKPTWKDALEIHSDLMKRMNLITIRRNKTFMGEYKLLDNIHALHMDMFELDDKSEEYNTKRNLADKLYTIMYAIQSKLKIILFEYEILEIEAEYYLKIINDYYYASEKEAHVCLITDNADYVKRITKNKCLSLERETCAICLDVHEYKDIVKTSCGHIFGKICFQNHLTTINKGNHSNVLRTSCPMCRRTELSFNLFALKK